ncbi:uncharacterized protein [Periplaneta americana]|uniref:uncharacterized protein n=1 Tax=Periplaneta americana TaxID=6978 RepID=UPI0037E7B309
MALPLEVMCVLALLVLTPATPSHISFIQSDLKSLSTLDSLNDIANFHDSASILSRSRRDPNADVDEELQFCCATPGGRPRTRDEYEQQKKEDKRVLEVCEAEHAKLLNETSCLSTKALEECKFRCAFVEYKMLDENGKIIPNKTLSKLSMLTEITDSRLQDISYEKCEGLPQASEERGPDHPCDPTAYNYFVCVSDVRDRYCDKKDQKKGPLCDRRREQLKKKYP